MKNVESNQWVMSLSLPATRTLDLLGKQSVRATFKLSRVCIETIDVVAAQLNIKKKSLFDHLAEDINSLRTIAEKIRESVDGVEKRVQKTYVLSRKSMEALSRISRAYGTPRDSLVEYSVRRLMPIIRAEKERHRIRKELHNEIETHFDQGRQLLNKMASRLEGNDAMFQMYRAAMEIHETQIKAIRHIVEQGETIEQFDPETALES